MKLFIAAICLALVASSYSQQPDIPPSILGKLLYAKANFTRRLGERADNLVHTVKGFLPFGRRTNIQYEHVQPNIQLPISYNVKPANGLNIPNEINVVAPIPRPNINVPRPALNPIPEDIPYIPNKIENLPSPGIYSPTPINCTESDEYHRELQDTYNYKYKLEADLERIVKDKKGTFTEEESIQLSSLSLQHKAAQSHIKHLIDVLSGYVGC